MISGQSDSATAVPVHSLVDHMNVDVVDILPPVYALTGCDTTSKVGTKSAALKTVNECGYELCFFGKTELTGEIISNVEKFLLKCVSDQNLDKSDDIRYELYHKKLHQFDVEKFPHTSNSIRQYILRAYL